MAARAIARGQITGLVLAGGLGRRMGGVDKGLIDWRGRPLAAHALERLAPQVGALAISANRNAGRYAALGAPVWADLDLAPAAAATAGDARHGSAGPDATTTGAPASRAGRGDPRSPRSPAMPQTPSAAPATDLDAGPSSAGFVSLGPLAGILGGLRRASTPWLAVVPCDAPRFPPDLVERLAAGRGDAPIAYARAARGHPVFCLVSTTRADALERALLAGERRVQAWIRAEGGVGVDFADEDAFANFNTPENLDAA